MMKKYPRVHFLIASHKLPLIAVGRNAETLLLLNRKGSNGVCVFDFTGGAAYRLAAYIHCLRTLGLNIETVREPHRDGFHARYFLHSPITVLDVVYDEKEVI